MATTDWESKPPFFIILVFVYERFTEKTDVQLQNDSC